MPLLAGHREGIDIASGELTHAVGHRIDCGRGGQGRVQTGRGIPFAGVSVARGGGPGSSLAKISNMTDYNALAALYQSGTEADYLRDAAKIREWEGKIAKREAIRGTVTNFMSYAGGAMGGMGGKGD